jgi:hypothetical protein
MPMKAVADVSRAPAVHQPRKRARQMPRRYSAAVRRGLTPVAFVPRGCARSRRSGVFYRGRHDMRNLLIAVLLFGAFASAQSSGARVTGRVVPPPGPLAAELRAIRVAITPSGYPPRTLETAVNADGAFEFIRVPAGPYIVRLITGNASVSIDSVYPTHSLFVGDGDLSGVEIAGPSWCRDASSLTGAAAFLLRVSRSIPKPPLLAPRDWLMPEARFSQQLQPAEQEELDS